MPLSQLCDEVAMFALHTPHGTAHSLRTLNRLPIVIVIALPSYITVISRVAIQLWLKSKSLSSDPEERFHSWTTWAVTSVMMTSRGILMKMSGLRKEWVGRLVCSRKMEAETVLRVCMAAEREWTAMEWMGLWMMMGGMEVRVIGQGSENGDGMDGSDNSDGTEGSENDRMDSDGENRGGDDHVNTNRNGLPVFAENVGVISDMTGKEPVDYYRLFITDSLLQNVLDETNLYGEQYVRHTKTMTAHPRARSQLCEAMIHNEWTAEADGTHDHNGYSGSSFFEGLLEHKLAILHSKVLQAALLWLFFPPVEVLHLADNTKQAARGQQAMTNCSSCDHSWILLFKALRRCLHHNISCLLMKPW